MDISRIQPVDAESVRVSTVTRDHGSNNERDRPKKRKRSTPGRQRTLTHGYEDYSVEELDEDLDAGIVSVLL